MAIRRLQVTKKMSRVAMRPGAHTSQFRLVTLHECAEGAHVELSKGELPVCLARRGRQVVGTSGEKKVSGKLRSTNLKQILHLLEVIQVELADEAAELRLTIVLGQNDIH